jgi:S-adenosylmethionine/arginine decarboxylase-like enzyme
MSDYKSPPIGNNMSWIFWNFDKELFDNPGKLECILRLGLKEDNLTPLEWYTKMFPDGYTMLVPLSESHLSVHTYKEYDSIAFGLYSCLGKDSGMKTYQKTLTEIRPKRTVVVRHNMPIDLHFLNDLEVKTHRS